MRLTILLILFAALLVTPAQAQRVIDVPVTASIQDAINAAPDDAVVRLAAGATYREAVTIDRPVTLDGNGARLSGAVRVQDGDNVSDPASGNPWPNDVQLDDRTRRNGGLTADGVYVARGDGFRVLDGRLDTDRRGRLEWATEPRVLAIEANGVTVSNLTVSHGASPVGGSCMVVYSDDVTIEAVTVEHCTYGGLTWQGSPNSRVARLTVNGLSGEWNGARCFGGTYGQDVTLRNVSCSSNGWRVGYAPTGNLRAWDGGQKVLLTNDLRIDGLTVADTDGIGLWLDFDNRNVVVENFDIRRSVLAEVFVEAHCEPVTLRNGVIAQHTWTSTQRDYWGPLFFTGSNNFWVENVRIEPGTGRWGVVMTNPVRSNLQPCQGGNRNGVFDNVTVLPGTQGAVNFAQDNGYVATTTGFFNLPDGGALMVNGNVLSPQAFVARLRDGAISSQDVPLPTAPPQPQDPPDPGTPLPTQQPDVTPTPTPGVLRIVIEYRLEGDSVCRYIDDVLDECRAVPVLPMVIGSSEDAVIQVGGVAFGWDDLQR